MADAGARRHDAEIVEGRLAPAQELVALAVALVFELDIPARRRAALPKSSTITEWSMTRSTGTSGLIFSGSPPSAGHRVAHGGEVDHGRHAGEILHQHARRAEGDLALARLRRQPGGDAPDVVGGDRAAVLEAQQVLEQHLQREGQAGDAGQAVLLGLGEAEIVVGRAADREGAPALEAVEGLAGHGQRLLVFLTPAGRSARARPLRAGKEDGTRDGGAKILQGEA